jgi:DNA (cytosine-5)-methyltransferase 1
VRDAIGDLPPLDGGQTADPIPRQDRILSELALRLRSGVASDESEIIYDHITRSVRPDDLEAFRLLPPGGTYADLPDRLQRYRSDIFTDKYKRLEWDQPSRSITAHLAKDGYWYIHPDQHRTLSVREAARIQTFPDWFRFSGAPTVRLRQIGNAVPPILAEAVGHSVLAALAAPGSPEDRSATGFRERLLAWHVDNRRDFAWRSGASPWHVLMAEMCLHRTRAEQALTVYKRLVEVAPTPMDMLSHRDEALETMRSLGLRWRAVNVVRVAEELVARFAGIVPAGEADLLSLPGVGDYVANAVRCFAFGKPAVLLDTNTERITGRVRKRIRARRWQLRVDLHELAGREGPDAALNYALLDLGALVCRAGIPICDRCPLSDLCATGSASKAPITAPRGEI